MYIRTKQNVLKVDH